MITAEELVIEAEQSKEANFKMATVADLFENDTAKLQFDGEESPSEKQYAYLDWYVPAINDRVIVGKMGGTYLVLGNVKYNEPPSTEEEIDRYLFDLKKVIMEKGLEVTGQTELGNVSADHATVSGLTSTGNATVGSLTSIGPADVGELSCTGSASVKNLTSAGDVNAASISTIGTASIGNLNHRGSYIGFFNRGSVVQKTSVATMASDAELSTVRSKLNQLISVLNNYNLV